MDLVEQARERIKQAGSLVQICRAIKRRLVGDMTSTAEQHDRANIDLLNAEIVLSRCQSELVLAEKIREEATA